MQVEARGPRQPRLHRRVFVGGVIVDDQVGGQPGGRFTVDLPAEGEPFLVGVLLGRAAQNPALQIRERGKQGDRYMTEVVVGASADVANAQGHARLGALPGLALALFIATQHQRPRGRVEVEPNDIPELRFKVGTVRQFEGAGQVRLDVIGLPSGRHGGDGHLGGGAASERSSRS